MASDTVRIAFEGCGHGTLNSIYASIAQTCKIKGWDGVDLLIIGGDFQAVRNEYDLNTVVLPPKYRHMGDFHEYYSGARKAPYLTLFIGGNHEAMSHSFELFYGGWVAPNIYYLGAANVLRFGPLRIAGLSGIWKGHSYSKPHYERIPYSIGDLRSAYYVREFDTRKLLQIRSPVDLGLSHDWPRGVEWMGDTKKLFGRHAHLEPDARDGVLGNTAARYVLDRLRPSYWFSAHFHCKHTALVTHGSSIRADEDSTMPNENGGEADLGNPDEIDLDLSDDGAEDSKPGPTEKNETKSLVPAKLGGPSLDELRELLPASFKKKPPKKKREDAPIPEDITNTETRFFALDKCLPGREFLQILEISGSDHTAKRPYALCYDKEWLAITRVFGSDLIVGDVAAQVPGDKGFEFYKPKIEKESDWVDEHLVKKGLMTVPQNFEITAPVYDASLSIEPKDQGREYTSPQTIAYCKMLDIPNPFLISEEELLQRLSVGPAPDSKQRGGSWRGSNRERGFHRGGRSRGRGRGRF